jgi:hypothetical protein
LPLLYTVSLAVREVLAQTAEFVVSPIEAMRFDPGFPRFGANCLANVRGLLARQSRDGRPQARVSLHART